MDRILLPMGNGDWLAMTPEELAAHRAAAVALGFGHAVATPTDTKEELLTAAQLAAVMKVAKSRIEQGTREGTIPCKKIGRYHRYRRSDVEKALTK
jgi:excisionase family DNA binding protein